MVQLWAKGETPDSAGMNSAPAAMFAGQLAGDGVSMTRRRLRARWQTQLDLADTAEEGLHGETDLRIHVAAQQVDGQGVEGLDVFVEPF